VDLFLSENVKNGALENGTSKRKQKRPFDQTLQKHMKISMLWE